MNLQHIAASLSCIALLAGVACGQSLTTAGKSQKPTPTQLAEGSRIAIHTAPPDDDGGDYGIWAAGNDYKVSFHDGMTFVPYLGRNAQSQSLRWRTLSVRCGNEELLSGRQPRANRRGDYRFEYHHGSVIEAYDVEAEGLEQTFVIAERPQTIGDLVVTGRIATSLQGAEQPARHGALTFLDASGRGVIGYGAATAIDARGRSIAMTTAMHEGHIALRLAERDVAAAEFPLVVDPLLTNMFLEQGAGITDVDIYYDDQEHIANQWIVHTRHASATDRDLVIRRHHTDFVGGNFTVYADLASQWDSFGGKIAGVGNYNDGRTVTVFTRDFGTIRGVRWHLHDKDDAIQNSSLGSLPNTWGTHQWRPAVGGTRSDHQDHVALIVYQEEDGQTFQNEPRSQVRGIKLDVVTGLPVGTSFALGGAGDIDEERPTVNRLTFGDGEYSWVVAWQIYNNPGNGCWRIAGQRIAASVGTNSTAMYLTSGSEHAITPRLSGYKGYYLLTYGTRPFSADKPQGHHCRAILSKRIDWSHSQQFAVLPFPEQQLWADVNQMLVVGGCAHDSRSRSHWVSTFVDEAPGNERLQFVKLGYDGGKTEGGVLYDTPGWQPGSGAVTYDVDERRFPVAFAVDDGSSSSSLLGTHVTYQSVASPFEYGSFCGVGTTQYHYGWQAVGSRSQHWELRTSLPNTPALFVASVGQTSLPLDFAGMTGCTLAIDPGPGLLGTILDTTNGSGDVDLTLPMPSSLLPFTLYSQWFLLLPGANPAGVVTSRGLAVPYGR